MKMKVRNKIALLFTGLMAILLAALSVFIYYFSFQTTQQHFFTRLKVRASLALGMVLSKDHEDALSVQELRERYLPLLPEEHDYFIHFDTVNKRWIPHATLNLPASFYADLQNFGTAAYENNFRCYAGLQREGQVDRAAIVYAYNEEGADQIQSLRRALGLGFAGSCIIIFGLGRMFAKQMIKPVADLTKEVNRITASNLDKRLPLPTSEDEMTALAVTYNNMLDRLQTAFELQSNFISNASHELRTPLTAILGETDLTLSKPRAEQEYINAVQSIQKEAQKLNDLVTSLLNLSQVGFDGKKQMLEEVSIDMLLMNIKSHLNKRFPDNHVRIVAKEMPDNPDGLVLVCIASWLELAFLNIISNAIKYSNNQEVLVTLSATDEEMTVQIYDSGIGITKEDMQHVFELFFRGSNSQTYSGHGIGLPLADKIIRLHGGNITIESEYERGTCVSVNFQKDLIRKR